MPGKMIKKIQLNVLIGLAFGLLAPVHAYDVDPITKKIIWKYYNGDTSINNNIHDASNNNGTRYGITYSSAGLIYPIGLLPSGVYASNFSTTPPLNIELATLYNDLSAKINFTLKETRNINLSNIVLSGSDQTNVKLAAGTQAEVWVTFFSEGAGYENSVGFFTYDPTSPPVRNPADGSNNLKTEQIIFPRASQPAPLPPAGAQGTTVYLGKFDGGAKGLGIGFFTAANGWNANGRTLADGTTKIAGVNEGQDKGWIFYSLTALNPEPETSVSSNLKQHTILLQDSLKTTSDNRQYQRLVFGFEDVRRDLGSSDNDFNDVLLVLHAAVPQNSTYTISNTIANLSSLPKLSLPTTLDTDGDGVNDTADEFPNDASKAYSAWYPGSNTYGTLAYEDQWPKIGDFDMNDLVLHYRSRQILNAQRQVKALEMDLQFVARGGNIPSGFALALPGIAPGLIDTTKTFLTDNNGTELPASAIMLKDSKGAYVTGEDGGAVFQIFSNAATLMPVDKISDGSAGCQSPGFYNTGKGCPIKPSFNFKLTVELATAQATFPLPPYDPFLFQTSTKLVNGANVFTPDIEIHLPNKQPTSRADLSLLTTQNDASVKPTGTSKKYTKSYMTSVGLPWALDIPIVWDYPYETLDTRKAYTTIADWAKNGGTTSTNWYLTPASAEMTFRNGR